MTRHVFTLVLLAVSATVQPAPAQDVLPGTQRWEDRGDPAKAMVDGLHRFLDRELTASVERRSRHWQRDLSAPEAYAKSIEPNRQRLARIIGAVEARNAPVVMELIASTDSPALLAEARGVRVRAVRWNAFGDVHGEGLLLEPSSGAVKANIVALADCDVTPEQFIGLATGVDPSAQVARLLAERGCRVLVPTLLDRSSAFSGNPSVRFTNLTHREWIWRMAFETARHPIGYEVEKVRAAVDWFQREGQPALPIAVVGHGEGGLIALYSAALDPRIGHAWVAGYYGPRERVWSEPIDRDVWRLLDEFGDAEIASLIAPRRLLIEACRGPEIPGPPPPARGGRSDAASGRLTTPESAAVEHEYQRLIEFIGPGMAKSVELLKPPPSSSWNADGVALAHFLTTLLNTDKANTEPKPTLPEWDRKSPGPDPHARMKRQVAELVDHTQALLRGSEYRRYALWSKAETTSPQAWSKSTEGLRNQLWDDVIGRLPGASEPLAARTVKLYETDRYIGYGVQLPVWPDVVASGVLLLPRDLKPGEKRPVVVCQHGLEGRPDEVVDPKIKSVYHAYGAQLADRGYIVYAPQNPYIGVDRFRQLQRKLHPLGKSLFSVIVRQHERTLLWLKTLPNVDPERIAFYGLSYGGKTAMRVPALLTDYCLSICSADFNEWVVKCTNLDRPMSYLYTIEYDMYEWGLADGFNYAEMAGLIAPRPFQVERGHRDGVAPDEWVFYEYAKVKRLYDTLGIGDRAELALFNGPHEIHGVETFAFLARHLNWPRGTHAP